MKKHILIATGAAFALLVATPAYAESNHSFKGDIGLDVGGIIRLLDNDRGHKKSDSEKRDEKRAASSVSISGTVTAKQDTVLSISGKNGAVYTVQAANALIWSGRSTSTLADIQVGDSVKVKGVVNGTIIVASKIHEKSKTARDTLTALDNVRAGIVTAVSGSGFTITRFGTGTSTTVNTNASTTVKVNGLATTSSAITPGSTVIVVGTSSTSSPNSVSGTVVHIITKGFGWLKHFIVG